MASYSSSSFTDEWKYDVFLSFRGIDTRSGFTGSLHRALCGKEIKSFMDDQNLEKGAEINPALDEAIQSSRIAVVVLSKNYASSTFCLDELRKIMDCSKDKGMLVLPVFYEVEPSDVRYQKGKYADALNKHEARITEKVKIEKWRVALTKISHISGWPFTRDRYEYELIDINIIVKYIIKKIQSLRDGEKDRVICKGEDKYVTQHDKVKILATEFLSPENEARQRVVAAMKIQNAFRNFHEARQRETAIKIQHAFRNFHEARQRVAAMKIQHAFRNFNEARQIIAAIKIQHAFRNFHEARQRVAAIKIQNAFRNFKEAPRRVAAIKIQQAFRDFKRRERMGAIQDPSDGGDDWRTFPHQENAKISQTSLLVNIYCAKDDGEWEDQGTGHVRVDYLERPGELGLFLYDEDDEEDDETVFWHRITSDDIYRKEEDKTISWREPEHAAELALSFYEPSGCSYIWDHICSVQSNMQFNNLNRVKSVERNSKQQKVTVTGHVGPNNVFEEAEIWPSVPYHWSTEIYADETDARSFDHSYIYMFSDQDANSCSIM